MKVEAGDVVVVPGVGVGSIEGTQILDVMGETVEVTRIVCEEASEVSTLYVPPDNLGQEGIREPISEEGVEPVLETIASTEAPAKRGTWNRRRRRYNDMLMSNEPMKMAELLGELASARSRKPLSFHERRLFERVKTMVVEELAVALDMSRDEVEDRLREALDSHRE
jgi:RNA polymerase-interacting CarD/CdnL/TRCF family regulator